MIGGQIRVYENLLRLTADPHFGDLMERTILNTLFGAQSTDGSHLRYFTPLQGDRVYTGECCCTGNFRRIISELPTMVYYRTENGVAINLYSTSKAKVALDEGLSIAVQQETNYPSSGNVVIRVDPSHPASFPLKLRIPRWCHTATVSVNNKPVETACTPTPLDCGECAWSACRLHRFSEQQTCGDGMHSRHIHHNRAALAIRRSSSARNEYGLAVCTGKTATGWTRGGHAGTTGVHTESGAGDPCREERR